VSQDLRGFLQDFGREFEPALRRRLDAVDHRYTPSLKAAMAYTLEAGGKRIRPAVIELWALTAGEHRAEDVLRAGIAVELIHTCSLILDDLPSMDDAGQRRGRPCCHLEFGVDTAILAANAQLMLAFEVLAELDGERPGLDAAGLLARAVGTEGMIGGQHVDLHYASDGRDLDALEYIHSHKTGVLFEACAILGVRLGGRGSRLEGHAMAYARNLGLAFQIKDDLLDAHGDPEEMGKDARKDKGKATFVACLGERESQQIMDRLLDTARATVRAIPEGSPYLLQLCDYVAQRRN